LCSARIVESIHPNLGQVETAIHPLLHKVFCTIASCREVRSNRTKDNASATIRAGLIDQVGLGENREACQSQSFDKMKIFPHIDNLNGVLLGTVSMRNRFM